MILIFLDFFIEILPRCQIPYMSFKDLFKTPEGITLAAGPCWEISVPAKPDLFIRQLSQLIPENALLYLEGNPVPDVRAFLDMRNVPVDLQVARGTLRPRPEVFYVRATAEHLEGVAELFEHHSVPEVCYHFHVLLGGRIVLQWHDAFGKDPLHIAGDISADKVESLARGLGALCDRTSLYDNS